jgi:hypothetical protein
MFLHTYAADEVWKSWPENIALANFVGSRAEVIISNTMSDFANGLFEELSHLECDLDSTISQFAESLIQLEDHFQDYLNSQELGDDFVK